jgi:hypothetical protein
MTPPFLRTFVRGAQSSASVGAMQRRMEEWELGSTAREQVY